MKPYFAGILGGWEIGIVLLAIVLLFFGGRKLPDLARGLGLSIKEFKKASGTAEEDAAKPKDGTNSPEKKP